MSGSRTIFWARSGLKHAKAASDYKWLECRAAGGPCRRLECIGSCALYHSDYTGQVNTSISAKQLAKAAFKQKATTRQEGLTACLGTPAFQRCCTQAPRTPQSEYRRLRDGLRRCLRPTLSPPAATPCPLCRLSFIADATAVAKTSKSGKNWTTRARTQRAQIAVVVEQNASAGAPYLAAGSFHGNLSATVSMLAYCTRVQYIRQPQSTMQGAMQREESRGITGRTKLSKWSYIAS